MKAPFHFLLIFCCCLSFSAVAQWSFGIKGSYVQSNQIFDFEYSPQYVPYQDFSKKIEGYGAAASIYYQINKFVQIGLEPGMVRRGVGTDYYSPYQIYDCGDLDIFNLENCETIPYSENKLFAQYLTLPLFIKSSFNIWKDHLAVFLKAGGAASHLVSAYSETTNIYMDASPEISTINFKEDESMNRWDLGWQAGSGLSIKTGPGSFILEAVYYRGLKDFYKIEKSRTRSFEYSLGYQINL